MIISQITSNGILPNQWVTLDKICKSMLFTNDGYGMVSPKSVSYYFDSNYNLVFVRHLNRNGNPLKGGINDKEIGIYHECYDIGEISVIF